MPTVAVIAGSHASSGSKDFPPRWGRRGISSRIERGVILHIDRGDILKQATITYWLSHNNDIKSSNMDIERLMLHHSRSLISHNATPGRVLKAKRKMSESKAG